MRQHWQFVIALSKSLRMFCNSLLKMATLVKVQLAEKNLGERGILLRALSNRYNDQPQLYTKQKARVFIQTGHAAEKSPGTRLDGG